MQQEGKEGGLKNKWITIHKKVSFLPFTATVPYFFGVFLLNNVCPWAVGT
ncbi:hypothetical protein QG37_01748 [Candidozyma auris]|uniref:Uncharacterized protein n=1 Tax=Candidozyma auris TaxID=498019 RepID=A0A0L0P3I8_CANAR|nr:hypothetical protein QG37_01748 [[Candida] auris]